MTRTFGVWFTSDIVFAIGVLVMGVSNGYFSSLAMMYAPRVVDGDKARIAGMTAALFLVLGITLGVNSSLIISGITENWGSLSGGTFIYNSTNLNCNITI